jgi:hypothetical protein
LFLQPLIRPVPLIMQGIANQGVDLANIGVVDGNQRVMFRPTNFEFMGSTVSGRNIARSSNKKKWSHTTAARDFSALGESYASLLMLVPSDNNLKEVNDDQ